MALPPEERPTRCWCVAREFPATLTARASAATCICQNCLDRYRDEEARNLRPGDERG
jgi:hypothetical protein